MINSELRIGGAVVFWGITEYSSHAVLKEGLTGLGYEKHIPLKRTGAAALKDALAEKLGSSRTLIRPLESKDGVEGFCVNEENRGTENNIYNHSLTAKIDKDFRITFSPYDGRAQTIVDEFNKQLGLIRPAQVTASLTAILGTLGGTSLRPKGSVYWLPEYQVSCWNALAKVVEDSAVSGKSGVYTMRNVMDHDARKAVMAAIVAEIVGKAAVIDEDITNGNLGERALERRKADAERLHKKISEYEEILSTGLDSLHLEVERAEMAIGKAALLAVSEVA